jgi:alpha-galactosidase
MVNIVIIGAGSASFGPATIATLLASPHLHGSRLALVDRDGAALQRVQSVAERMNESWRAGMTIAGSTERGELLAGADFVIVSIEVPPREKLWRLDWEIPLRHGLRQPYGENGGPGGMMHTFRQVPPLLEIVRDMEALCPDAWLINFSNPLPRLTRAVTRYSDIKTVGKCHQIEIGYAIVAALLGSQVGIEVPPGLRLYSDPANTPLAHQMARHGRQHFAIKAAGLNHFTWMVDVRRRDSQEDLYPALRAAAATAPPEFEPLSMDLFRAFNTCPVPGDTHLAEYVAWTHDPHSNPWQRYDIRLYDWEANEKVREYSHHRLAQMAAGTISVDGMRDSVSEGAVEIIEGITGNCNRYEEAVNVPNNGAIANLPPETIVELPAVVSGMGIQPLQIGPLPAGVAELCRREAALVELVVEAAVTGDRELALQALLLDPMVNDTDRARAILDDYLETFAPNLPQFAGGG